MIKIISNLKIILNSGLKRAVFLLKRRCVSIHGLPFLVYLNLFSFIFLGEIGGQLGLCIGASLLTVLEFCDVIFSIARLRLGGQG